MLISDWHHPPSIQDLSKHLGMSATKAKMLFKQVFGYPPHQYFKRKRMEAAYHILLEKKYNVTEVGRHLGYKSLSHFSSDFKSYFGVFPKKLAMQVEANEMRSGKSQETASKGM
jgi:AraC-like DNA-binding protein